MAKKKDSIGQRVGQTAADMADALSVAATGSQIGLLEMAVEEELGFRPAKWARRTKATPKKKVQAGRFAKPTKKKRTAKRQ